METGGPWLYTK